MQIASHTQNLNLKNDYRLHDISLGCNFTGADRQQKEIDSFTIIESSTRFELRDKSATAAAAAAVVDILADSISGVDNSAETFLKAWFPEGDSRIFRSYVFGPSGFWTMAPLHYAAEFDPFLSLECAPRPPPWCNPRKGRDQILQSGNTVSRWPSSSSSSAAVSGLL